MLSLNKQTSPLSSLPPVNYHQKLQIVPLQAKGAQRRPEGPGDVKSILAYAGELAVFINSRKGGWCFPAVNRKGW